MFPKLAKAVKESMPKFNETLLDGFHQKEFESGDKYYERCLKMIFKSVAKKGVVFKGVERVSPREFIQHITRNPGRRYDNYRETLYPVKLHIEFHKNGTIEKFPPIYQMLPYTNKYGDVWLKDVFYSLQFVLAERGLPVTKENAIFVKVLGFKFKVGAEYYRYANVMKTGDIVVRSESTINMSSNRFYSPTEDRRITDTKTPIPLLSWYVFGMLGFNKAMELADCECVYGPEDAIVNTCSPGDRWEIIGKPNGRNVKGTGHYIDHDFAIAIRNKSDKRKMLSSLGLQYACALLMAAECMSSYFEENRVGETAFWRLIIGRCSVKPIDTDEYIGRLMDDHFVTINEYLDEDSIKKFASRSIVVNDIIDLFNYIIANRAEIVQTTDRASMLNKELASLEFTLDPLITAANNLIHDIKNNSELSYRKVARFLTNNLKLKTIESATKTNLVQEATPTDCPLSETMLGCMPQHKVFTDNSKVRKKSGFDVTDTAGHLHPSLLFVNSLMRVTAPFPDSRGYLNPCIHLINGRTTAIHPKFMGIYERVEHGLKYREITNEPNSTDESVRNASG